MRIGDYPWLEDERELIRKEMEKAVWFGWALGAAMFCPVILALWFTR